jgi:hypothetical protein
MLANLLPRIRADFLNHSRKFAAFAAEKILPKKFNKNIPQAIPILQRGLRDDVL